MMADLCGVTLNNQYFLREIVGSGGMADVYQAWDTLRSTQLAIKVLRRDLAKNPRFIRLFEQEASVLAALDHPNIVRLYEFQKENDVYFLVMDWVDGHNLRQLLSEGNVRLPLSRISSILQPIASALAYAHRRNVFHCDVKTANILMSNRGEVLLTDFGVAHLAQEVGRGGTPPYMAPEQFTGDPITAQTDVYALGIVLYELLSKGMVPFSGENAGNQGSSLRDRIGWEHCNLAVPSLRHNDRSIPEAVEQVVMTALCKFPQERYGSPLDLWEAFEHALTVRQRSGSSAGTVYTSTMLQNVQSDLPQQQPLTSEKKQNVPRKKSTVKAKGPHLVGRGGEYTGQVIIIPGDGLSIGRSSQNRLRLSERSVSRTHAVLMNTAKGIFIRDENSALGIYVNRQRLTAPQRLKHGDVIQIGYQQIFEFREK